MKQKLTLASTESTGGAVRAAKAWQRRHGPSWAEIETRVSWFGETHGGVSSEQRCSAVGLRAWNSEYRLGFGSTAERAEELHGGDGLNLN
ncbi:hypothetical protein M0R45_030401 [Rubus argutus]|uniref:Uncharacterized protein n=1 Tax=Rubus argutus TaxID=59490 RepID=A0AAW1WBD9_RUBAR